MLITARSQLVGLLCTGIASAKANELLESENAPGVSVLATELLAGVVAAEVMGLMAELAEVAAAEVTGLIAELLGEARVVEIAELMADAELTRLLEEATAEGVAGIELAMLLDEILAELALIALLAVLREEVWPGGVYVTVTYSVGNISTCIHSNIEYLVSLTVVRTVVPPTVVVTVEGPLEGVARL